LSQLSENLSRTIRNSPHALACVALLAGIVSIQSISAQNLSYDTRRDIAIPDHSTLRIGPFYSTVRLTTTAGYRYTTGSGAGTDFVIDNQRGRIRSDGSDFPVTTSLDFRNYVPITRHTDLDFSVRVSYRYFPLDTQENEFNVSMPDEGVNANISSEFQLSPYLRGSVFDRFKWVTDYVDDSGVRDNIGGRRYERAENTVGLRFDWLMAKDNSLGLTLSRFDLVSFEDEFEFQDRVTYQEELRYEDRIIEGVVAGAGIRFHQTDFDDPDRADTDQSDVFFFLRATGSERGLGRFPITDATTIELSAGVSAGTEERSGSRSRVDADGDITPSVDLDEDDRRLNRNRDTTRMNADAKIRTDMSKYLAHEFIYRRGLRSGFNSSFEEFDRFEYSIDYNRVGVGVRLFTDYDVIEPTDEVQGYNTWIAGVAVNYPLIDYVDLDFSYRYNIRSDRTERLDEEGDTTIEENTRDFFDNIFRIGTSVAVYREVKVITYYERYERKSTGDERDSVRNTFQILASYSHEF
jgi:hypothetical protein